MPTTPPLYTYRCGEKIELEKNPHQFVVRSLPKNLRGMSWNEAEQVSSASTRITASSDDLEAAMNSYRGMATTHHAYQTKEAGDEFLITDRVFVRFKKNASKKVLNEFIGKYNLILISKYSAKEYLFQLTNYTGMNPVKLVVLLTEKEKLVKSAGHDLNKRVKKYQPLIPNDPEYINQWHLHERLNHPEVDLRSSARCEEAWELLGNYGSNNVVIAVSDDGCRIAHDDFNTLEKFASWAYFQGTSLIDRSDINAQDNLMYEAGSDHGTSCAGVIAGEVDGVKTVGAAPKCQLFPIKWESSGPSLFISDSKLITALNHIANKADVMSNSWGSSPSSNWELEVLNKIDELSKTGGPRGKGIVFLWAAGNENCPIQHQSNLDIPYTGGWRHNSNGWFWDGVRTAKFFRHNLTSLDGVMHIAALASTAQRSHYSNYGTSISLCAPSSNSHTYSRIALDGLGVTTATGSNFGVTSSFGGTSSATPLVAGIAGLIISANPALTAAEVISILKSTASKDLNFTDYPRTPSASYDSDTSWDISPAAPFDQGDFTDEGFAEGTWSPWFGHGKVDAFEAVSEALARIPSPPTSAIGGSSRPALSIPDKNNTGISDSINISQNGSLTDIKVTVNITHTYIGDIVISLRSPSGTEVVLQDRNGGSANNLAKVFDKSNAPFLNSLMSEEINGDWTLKVVDEATADVGTLDNWSIALEISDTKEISIEESPGMPIPDNSQAGIERILNLTKTGRIKSMEVELDITHTYIGDLSIELISPANDNFSLHHRSGGSRDNIIKKYTSTDTPILANLHGKSIKGKWKLRIRDHANVDIGKLNFWRIKFVL